MTIEHPERHIPERTLFNQATNEFVTIPEMTIKPIRLQLEHSLISIRIWEAEYQRPFSDIEEMNGKELLSYIKCMTVNTQKDESVYDNLTIDDVNRIANYITRANSAWEIKRSKNQNQNRRNKNRLNTVEGIYFAMIQYGIPFEPCEKWHLGSLMALIDYCSRNGNPGMKEKPKNMRELRESWYRINEANKKKYHSRG